MPCRKIQMLIISHVPLILAIVFISGCFRLKPYPAIYQALYVISFELSHKIYTNK